LDLFLNELTIMFERSTETGSVWVTLKRCVYFIMPPFHVLGVPLASLKSKAVRNKMAAAGEAIDINALFVSPLGRRQFLHQYVSLVYTELVILVSQFAFRTFMLGDASFNCSAGHAGKPAVRWTEIQRWFEDRLQDLLDDPNNELMILKDPECNKEGKTLSDNYVQPEVYDYSKNPKKMSHPTLGKIVRQKLSKGRKGCLSVDVDRLMHSVLPPDNGIGEVGQDFALAQ
ncbi:hypothetical protein HN873_047709, partial [Arachis hypogaea]